MHSAAVEESSKRNLALPRIILHEMRVKDAFLTDLGPRSVARIAQCGRNAGAKTPVAYTVGPPGALSAIFHLEAPARARAFADEQRVVAGDEGRRVRTRNARPAPRWRGSATVGLTMWLPYLRPNTCPLSSRRGRDSAPSTPAWASPPSVVTRPRVAARSPKIGRAHV